MRRAESLLKFGTSSEHVVAGCEKARELESCGERVGALLVEVAELALVVGACAVPKSTPRTSGKEECKCPGSAWASRQEGMQ